MSELQHKRICDLEERLANAERERDAEEAERKLGKPNEWQGDIIREQRTEIERLNSSLITAQSERDSARSSLARVVEAAAEVLNYIGLAEFLDSVHAHGNSVWGIRKDDLLTLRSALHRSQGE